MGEFFKGWKRKAGIASLTVAIIITGAWVRSHRFIDKIKVPLTQHTELSLYSFHTVVSLDYRWATEIDLSGTGEKHPERHFQWMSTRVKQRYEQPERFIPQLSIHPFHTIWDNGYSEKGFVRTLGISHIILVLPLTLLSAYLFLSEPRQAKPKST